MIRCNCGEMLPLTTTGPAHVCPISDTIVSPADARVQFWEWYSLLGEGCPEVEYADALRGSNV